MNKIISSPGKIILSGEYAVVEGQYALSAAINKRIYIKASNSNIMTVSNTKTGPYYIQIINNKVLIPKDKNNYFALVKASLQTLINYQIKFQKYNINIDSSKLYINKKKFGIGSSGAIITSLIYLFLNSHNKKKYNTNFIFNIAKKAHKLFAGKFSSGVDISTSLLGGLTYYNKNSLPKIIANSLFTSQLSIICCFTGQSQCTKMFLKKVKKYKQKNPIKYIKIIKHLTLSSNNISNCFLSNYINTTELNCAIKENVKILIKLGHLINISIITKEHNNICKIAQKYNSYAKPSGAGGGDISICFIKKTDTKKIIHELFAAGYFSFEAEITQLGTYINL